jgi:hypothetical protein
LSTVARTTIISRLPSLTTKHPLACTVAQPPSSMKAPTKNLRSFRGTVDRIRSSSCVLLSVLAMLSAGSWNMTTTSSTPANSCWGLTLPTADAVDASTANLFRSRHHGLLNSLLHTRGGSLPNVNPSGEVAPDSTTPAASIEMNKESNDSYEIVSDEVLHDHWRRLIRRSVRLPGKSKVVDFEIVAQKGTDQAVLVFCWNTASKRATLIREYMPSTHCRMMGLAAGMVEDDKHGNGGGGSDETTGDAESGIVQDYEDDMRLTAAKHELEEECRLVGGKWIRLTERGVVMDKYSTTRLSVYLVLDPEPVHADDAKPRDLEEDIQVVPGVSIDEIRDMIVTGRMTVVGGWASLLALQKLRELGEIED